MQKNAKNRAPMTHKVLQNVHSFMEYDRQNAKLVSLGIINPISQRILQKYFSENFHKTGCTTQALSGDFQQARGKMYA